MNSIIENLLALQEIALRQVNPSVEEQTKMDVLRRKIPEGLLSQFDRWLAGGRKAVAVVNHGVCGECHLRLTVGTTGALAFGEAIQHCSNCGRFLYLPEDDAVSPPAPAPRVKPNRLSRRASAHAK
ncbi:MAG: hypothetical protein L0Y58_13805 [Verrucomicrobia subdivision 3 bacterium]|nr:hypothetical protein [Limisphaerales bacterium]